MIRLGIVTATLTVLVSTGAAEAARCPAGEIWRVSKQKCQSKALAIKLGIIKPGKGKAQFIKKRRSSGPLNILPTNKPVSRASRAARKRVRKIPIHRPAAGAPEPAATAVATPAIKTQPTETALPANAAKPATNGAPAIQSGVPVKAAASPPAGKAVSSTDKPAAKKDPFKKDPFAAITAAAPLNGTRPMGTRMVEASYFNATPGRKTSNPRDDAMVRRAVLNLLKSRLQAHAERNRQHYISSVAGQ